MVWGRRLALEEVGRVRLEAIASIVIGEELYRVQISYRIHIRLLVNAHQVVGKFKTVNVADVDQGLVLGIILRRRSNVRLDTIDFLILALGRTLMTDT